MDESSVVSVDWRKQGILNLENKKGNQEGEEDQPRIGYSLKVNGKKCIKLKMASIF